MDATDTWCTHTCKDGVCPGGTEEMCKCGADAVGVTSVRPVAKASVKAPAAAEEHKTMCADLPGCLDPADAAAANAAASPSAAPADGKAAAAAAAAPAAAVESPAPAPAAAAAPKVA